MPELPEVETVRRVLEKQLLGLTITDVKFHYAKIIDNVAPTAFHDALCGETFRQMARIGKYLIFILDHVSFVAHLRMEGKFFIKDIDAVLEKHEHVEFCLSNRQVLRYHDTRKFGRFYLVQSTDLAEIRKLKEIAKLGPDGNLALPVAEIYQKLHKSHLPIKSALLDQTIISGIGNIYADEILFKCKLNPLTCANNLRLDDVKRIADATNEILNQAITDGGTTIRSYTSSLGVTGRFQQHLFVHTKDCCGVCHSNIKKIYVGGRGTYYCPICEKESYPFKIIGVCGMIASGKTTLTDYLSGLGYPVIDCDVINRELLTAHAKTKELLQAIKALCPDAINNNLLDKAFLRKALFQDPTLKAQLEALIHPLVKDEVFHILDQLKDVQDLKYVFLSAPLLVESNLHLINDHILYLIIQNDVWQERLTMRDHLNKQDALAIMQQDQTKANMAKIKDAEIPLTIIDNSYDLTQLYQQINKFLDT